MSYTKRNDVRKKGRRRSLRRVNQKCLICLDSLYPPIDTITCYSCRHTKKCLQKLFKQYRHTEEGTPIPCPHCHGDIQSQYTVITGKKRPTPSDKQDKDEDNL